MNPETIRNAVRSLYDAQKLRIEMSNRLSAQERDDVLSEKFRERLEKRLAGMIAVEHGLLLDLGMMIRDVDIYPWLKEVKGCGPAMSGVLIAEIQDPTRFANVSKLWAYSGLHVIDGRAARRKKGEKANWNNFLKTKLLGVLAGSFLKCSSPYRDHYDNYRTRIENRPCSLPPEKHKAGAKAEDLLPNGCTAGHMHNKAMRYMANMFLRDLLVEWRALRGLETRCPYAEEYLGRGHHRED